MSLFIVVVKLQAGWHCEEHHHALQSAAGISWDSLQTSGLFLFALSPRRSLLAHNCYLTAGKAFAVISSEMALGR